MNKHNHTYTEHLAAFSHHKGKNTPTQFHFYIVVSTSSFLTRRYSCFSTLMQLAKLTTTRMHAHTQTNPHTHLYRYCLPFSMNRLDYIIDHLFMFFYFTNVTQNKMPCRGSDSLALGCMVDAHHSNKHRFQNQITLFHRFPVCTGIHRSSSK